MDHSDETSRRFLRASVPVLLLTGLLLSLGTAFVFLYVASEEPFFYVDPLQLAVVLGGGGALFVGWIGWGLVLGASVDKARRVALLVVSIPWLLVNLAALGFAMHGYVEDLRHFTRSGSSHTAPAFFTLGCPADGRRGVPAPRRTA